MSKLNKYILSNLSSTFFPIFLTLFAITSVIFLVKIASLTSVITMDFSELLFLYLLKVPLILFYTLPVTYFAAATISIAKMSSEYELIVITSFGLSPLRILKILIPISLLFTISLLIISYILIPKATYIQSTFINKKKQEAKFNIKPSEYGQKFGPWYMYVNSKDGNTYKDIMLYQNNNNKDTFVLASTASIVNNKNSLKLELTDGTASIIDDNLKYIEFYKMQLNSYLKQERQISTLKDLINYWLKDTNNDQKYFILANFFISILPLISILFYIAFGYYNPRHQKNYSTIYSTLFIIIYVIAMKKISSTEDIHNIYTLPLAWVLISIFVYLIRIKKYY